jgi:hypothetical protein
MHLAASATFRYGAPDMTILFELGRESELAFLELEAVLTRYKLRPVLVSPGWATLTIQEMSHPGLMTFVKKLQFQLGGVRQIWLVIGTKVPAAKIYPLITNWWHGHYHPASMVKTKRA